MATQAQMDRLVGKALFSGEFQRSCCGGSGESSPQPQVSADRAPRRRGSAA